MYIASYICWTELNHRIGICVRIQATENR